MQSHSKHLIEIVLLTILALTLSIACQGDDTPPSVTPVPTATFIPVPDDTPIPAPTPNLQATIDAEVARALSERATADVSAATTRTSEQPASGPFCGRTAQIVSALENAIGKNCSSLTDDELATVTSLDLSNSGISSLQSGDFGGLTNLQGLGLEGNDLKALPTDIFLSVPKLQRLRLTNNSVGMLQPDIFAGLSNLQRLDLSDNALNVLPSDVFTDLSSLQVLYLGGNRLSELPPAVFTGLDSLQPQSTEEIRVAAC